MCSSLEENTCLGLQKKAPQNHVKTKTDTLQPNLQQPPLGSALSSASSPDPSCSLCLSPSLHPCPPGPLSASVLRTIPILCPQHPAGSKGLYGGGMEEAKKKTEGGRVRASRLNPTTQSYPFERLRLRVPVRVPSHPRASPCQCLGTLPPPYPTSGNLTSLYIRPWATKGVLV